MLLNPFVFCFNLKCYYGEFILRLKVEMFIFIFINTSSWEKIKWIWLKRRICQNDLDFRKIMITYKKPNFVKIREAVKQIEMLTESIPQLILQIYIFQTKNDIFNVFSSPSIFYELYKSAQIRSIFTSTLSIIFGLISIYGYKAFYYYEYKRILLGRITHPEKGPLQKIGRFISLFFWYFSVVISRILLIAIKASYELYLLLPFILAILIKSLILNSDEKKYFEQKKFIVEFEKETTDFRKLYSTEKGFVDIEKLIYFKPKSLLKSILSFFYMIFGVYDNVLINIEYHSNTFYIPRQTKNYLAFYFLFYIENIIFAMILYFGFNNNLRIIFFYVFTFPISVLIQILYRRVIKEEEVSIILELFIAFSINAGFYFRTSTKWMKIFTIIYTNTKYTFLVKYLIVIITN